MRKECQLPELGIGETGKALDHYLALHEFSKSDAESKIYLVIHTNGKRPVSALGISVESMSAREEKRNMKT